jgi:hypothetical protein
VVAVSFSGSFLSEARGLFLQGKGFDLEVVAGKTIVGAAFGAAGGAAPSDALRRVTSIAGSTWWSLVKTRRDAGVLLPRPPWDPRQWSPVRP